jgi:hypothetical protein
LSLRRAIRTGLPTLLALVLAGVIGLQAAPAGAGSVDDEQLFVQLINQTRAEAGLPALEVHSELRTQARSWASSMAASDHLSHSSDITAGISAPWTVLGENVGVHGVHEPEQLFAAFVASASHYKNIVDPRFSYVGVGVVNTSEGKIWTTHRFMATNEAATTTTPPAPPPTTAAPTTAPPTTTPPTTAPTAATAPTTAAPTTASPTTAKSPKAGPSTSSADPDGSPATNHGATSDPALGADPSSSDAGTDDDTGTAAGRADPPGAQGGAGSDDPSTGETPTRPVAGPGRPDITTVEDLLLGLIEAGI